MATDQTSRVGKILDDYLAQVARGAAPDKDAFLAQHADVAESLEACLASLQWIHTAARQQGDRFERLTGDLEPALTSRTLGDFRLVREIGRGGMGVVYEAQQRSLSRRVALKILPFASMLDPRQRQRFLNEAHAAAQLNHPNIIDVFAVGCKRGVHYYAMRLVEGPTLAEVVDQLRAAGRTNHRPLPRAVADLAGWNAAAALSVAPTRAYAPSNGDQSLCSAGLLPSLAELNAAGGLSSARQVPDRAGCLDTDEPADSSTWSSRPGETFFRCVAEVGIQVARALDYAHEVGIIHRDIKPSNLIVDAHGKVWVTDFGLARLEANAELTMTGDLLGTLRYMSPEQFLGRPAAVDHRTDIYSLGATLYELLTLRPAFAARDRAELLRTITVESPKSPRKLARSLPVELETIVLKALEKNPADRYGTAGELADDLQRFLEHRPIRARRSRVTAHATALWRRHQVLFVGVLTTLLLASSIGTLLVWQQRQQVVEKHALVVKQDADLRQRLYAADMKLAHQAWQRGDVARAQELLDRYAGSAGNELRDFAWQYLSNLLAARPAPLTVLRPGHGNVYCVQFSADGKHLAAACGDGHVDVWNVADWSPRHTITAHEADADCVAFSPDGKLLASGGEDGWLRLWDVERGELVRSIDARQKDTLTVAISPDGQTLASGGLDGYLRLWRLPQGELQNEYRASQGRVHHLAFSPDGAKLAVACGDGSAFVVDPTTYRRLFLLPGQSMAAFAVAFSAAGDQVALGSGSGLVSLVDASGRNVEHQFGIRPEQVRTVGFSPTRRLLASAGVSGVVGVWDTVTRSLSAKLYGHEKRIWSLSFSPDGKLLASGGDDGSVHIWNPDAESGLAQIENAEPIYDLRFGADGDHLFTADDKQELVTWDPAMLQRLAARKLPDTRTHELALSPDRRKIAVRTQEGEVWLGDTMGGGLTRFEAGLEGRVEKIALARDARLMLWYANGGLEVWDTATRSLLDRRQLPRRPGAFAKAVSRDGRFVAANCDRELLENDSGLMVYDIETLTLLYISTGKLEDIYCVALSPDNRWLAAAWADGPISFFETSSGAPAFSLIGHQHWVDAMAFSPDGRTLATAGHAGAVRLWNVVTREEMFVVRRLDSNSRVLIDFSPDGSRLAAATIDREAHGQLFVWSTSPVGP